MIQQQTLLRVADNTGAKIIGCFKVLGGTRKRYARIGDLIIASVKVAEPRKMLKKKDIVRAVVVRQRQALRRSDGSSIRFDDNAAVVVDDKGEPKGGRIFGPIPRELRERFPKIIGLAEDVV
ncbi:MAG: 50S ribosomal protein L14 [Candidatus Niyogibacteria bacterium]|nr:50S ribosomal protein L14 [Candidatus Niyogibacteria bacterium]